MQFHSDVKSLADFTRAIGDLVEILHFPPLFHDLNPFRRLYRPDEDGSYPFTFCREVEAEIHPIN